MSDKTDSMVTVHFRVPPKVEAWACEYAAKRNWKPGQFFRLLLEREFEVAHGLDRTAGQILELSSEPSAITPNGH